MFTYNITFALAPDKENEFIDYLRRKFIPAIFGSESAARNPELKKVVEIGGEKPHPEQGLSIALSAEFPSVETAHVWNHHTLAPALQEFHLKFGQHALFFATLLENITI